MAQDHGDEPLIEALLWGWQVAMSRACDDTRPPSWRALHLTRAGIMRRHLQELFARQDALLQRLETLLVDQQKPSLWCDECHCWHEHARHCPYHPDYEDDDGHVRDYPVTD